jgi:E3 ubiquitin-protein ligase HERC2
VDAGGPFRESITNIASELMSDVLPLLVKSANNKQQAGDCQDCYVVNPSAKSPTHMKMFKFFGALLGYSIRTKSPTPMSMAPVFWKQITNQTMFLTDLSQFDTFSYKLLRDLEKLA